MVDDIYKEVRDEVYSRFTGKEIGTEMRAKVNKTPPSLRTQLKSIVAIQVGGTPTLSEAVFCIMNSITTRPIRVCPTCNCEHGVAKFCSIIDGYTVDVFCSNKCMANNPVVRAKTKETLISCHGVNNPFLLGDAVATNIAKYGVPHPMQNPDVFAKAKATNIERYGVENPNQNTTIQAKSKVTNRARHGADFPSQNDEVRKKAIVTNQARRGVDYPTQSPVVRTKVMATNIDRYGVENVSQNAEIHARKQRKPRKTGTWPSGMEYSYQGYEDVGINTLLDSGLTEDQLVISTPQAIPTITYFNPVKNKDCRYFPDIFIPHENRLIEIKSEYTMGVDVEVNMAKHYASILSGFQHEIWVCSSTKVLDVIK